MTQVLRADQVIDGAQVISAMLVTELNVFLVILSSTGYSSQESCGSYPLKVMQGRQNFSICKIVATQATEFT